MLRSSRLILNLILSSLIVSAGYETVAAPPKSEFTGIKVGTFSAEVRTASTTAQGLPDNNVTAVAVTADGGVYAGTPKGLARFHDGQWTTLPGLKQSVTAMASHGEHLVVIAGDSVYGVKGADAKRLAKLPKTLRAVESLVVGTAALIGTKSELFRLNEGRFVQDQELGRLLKGNEKTYQVAVARDGRIAVAAQKGLFVQNAQKKWRQQFPRTEQRSWAPYSVRGVAFDSRDRLWFASPQGVGVLDGKNWTLYTGEDGLPYNDFTTAAAGGDGAVWFGTKIGAIRFDGAHWSYRQGKRWLPHDEVRDIAVTPGGDAWFATPKGVSVIERRPLTFAEKAKFYEDEIDKYHRRTEYGFVDGVHLKTAGDKSTSVQHDSDNDGLWTAMYGAGECFAYAATKDPQARKRAKAAFEALRFLSVVTQGGKHSPPPGFPARTILPTSGVNPNETHYTAEHDRGRQKQDPFWKVIVPRWPTSADGKWYWKCDTSSDELDGHFFLYACYYDLVAETEEEKARVRDVVLPIADHLIAHGFQLVDHDGKVTRWGFYDPRTLHHEQTMGRGLNSLSILSYLKVAEHVSGGDPKYKQAYDYLIKEHGYATNVEFPKWQNGPGSGNQSDDEMAFMCYYNLLKYETDPRLRSKYMHSLWDHWRWEEPERCPLFNFIFAAQYHSAGVDREDAPETVISDAVDDLRRIPLDRVRWGFKNSHRLDIVPLGAHIHRHRGKGHLRSGKVLPTDERHVHHWNHDVWRLNEGGGGREMGDGTVFLLPYYLGLYHGFIVE